MVEAAPVPPTAAIADAALRLGIDVVALSPRMRPVAPHAPVLGRAAPVTHLGSVDVILEAIDDAEPGDVLVVDNGGRLDEACVGDLIVLEAREQGLSAAIIWGLHRDTADLLELALPLHSLGAMPFGPRRVPPAGSAMRSALVDGVPIGADDWIAADADGVLVLRTGDPAALLAEATRIATVERAQSDRMRAGVSLRAQIGFADYRRRQADDPTLTLRRHLAERGGAIET